MDTQRQVDAALPLMGRRGEGETSPPGLLEKELMNAMDVADKEGFHGNFNFVVGHLVFSHRDLALRMKRFLEN